MDIPCRRLIVATLVGMIAAAAAPYVRAQSDGLLQLDDDLHTYLENQRTLGRLPNAHLTHKPISIYEAREYLEVLRSDSSRLRTDRGRPSTLDSRDETVDPQPPSLDPRDQAPDPRLSSRPLGPFYANGFDFWSVEGDDYGLQVNPLLYLTLGQATRWIGQETYEDLTVKRARGERLTWRNTRGLRASGHIGSHIFYEARVEETQERPSLAQFAARTSPRLVTVRPFTDSTGYDYQVAIGMIGFRSDHFEVRFGRDRNHWGYGEGSLILSDYSPAYDQLQIRTSFWRLQYVNLFSGFTDLDPFGRYLNDAAFDRKYGAFHRLSVNVTDRINLSVFESVIFGPDATSDRDPGFDWAYLNPVIFYRPVESDRGSPDNVLIGFGGSWIVVDGMRLYGEVLLDEFVVRELFTQMWRNKTGYLAGLHVAPSTALSLRAEYARLRPFLYTHRSPTMAYMHFLDPLGHPAGPNATDVALFMDWRPRSSWRATVRAAYTERGRGTASQNVGSDLRLNYHTRFANRIPMLAGIRQRRLLVEAAVAYEILPELFFEIGFQAENVHDVEAGDTGYVEPLVSLRWGLPLQSARY